MLIKFNLGLTVCVFNSCKFLTKHISCEHYWPLNHQNINLRKRTHWCVCVSGETKSSFIQFRMKWLVSLFQYLIHCTYTCTNQVHPWLNIICVLNSWQLQTKHQWWTLLATELSLYQWINRRRRNPIIRAGVCVNFKWNQKMNTWLMSLFEANRTNAVISLFKNML